MSTTTPEATVMELNQDGVSKIDKNRIHHPAPDLNDHPMLDISRSNSEDEIVLEKKLKFVNRQLTLSTFLELKEDNVKSERLQLARNILKGKALSTQDLLTAIALVRVEIWSGAVWCNEHLSDPRYFTYLVSSQLAVHGITNQHRITKIDSSPPWL